MRELPVRVSILAAVLYFAVLLSGCGAEEERTESLLMHTAGRNPGKLDWESFDMEQLITLFSRGDPSYERALLRGLDSDISFYACLELDRRMGKDGLDALTPEQRNRLVNAVRIFLSDRRYWVSATLLDFAAKYDPHHASHLFLKNKEVMDAYPKIAFTAISKAGAEGEAWAMIAPRLNAADEQEVCHALRLIGIGQLKVAADEVVKRTNALRWMIRLQALHTLDQLDDPRTIDALQSHLGDFKRSSIGLRIFSWPYAMRATMAQEFLKTELIKALVRRKVPGAADTLESIALNSWQGESMARMAAGVGLAMLDRARGVAAVKRLLRSSGEGDQYTGVGIASHGLAEEVKDDLQLVAEKTPYEMVRDAAGQVLEDLKDRKDLPSESKGLFF
jgi:hypothetical protein